MVGSTRTSEAIVAALRYSRHDGADSAALHQTLVDAVERSDQATLVELAKAHRVGALLYDELHGTGALSEDASQELGMVRRLGRARNLMVGRTAHQLASILDDVVGDRWVIFKGPALGAWYGDRIRTYVDLDVLVDRSAFEAAMTAMEGGGFPSLTQNWGGFLDHGVGEVPMGEFRMVIDLHWHPIALRASRRDFRWNVPAVIERRSEFAGPEGPLPTLDPVDSLIHLCSHTGLSGARRLVWLSDVDIVARSGQVDWAELVTRARLVGVATMCAAVLDRTRQLLDTPLPDGLVRELSGVPGWITLNRKLARDRSDERAVHGWSTGVLQSASRDSTIRTLRALAKLARSEIDVRRGKPALTEDSGELDWHRVDDGVDLADTKRAWLDYVGSEAT